MVISPAVRPWYYVSLLGKTLRFCGTVYVPTTPNAWFSLSEFCTADRETVCLYCAWEVDCIAVYVCSKDRVLHIRQITVADLLGTWPLVLVCCSDQAVVIQTEQ